jgi:hypothetical protein
MEAYKKETHNITLFFVSTLLEHGHHFDYWNQPLNICMRICYLDCHDAGLCWCLVIHIESIMSVTAVLLPFVIYWLCLVLETALILRRTSLCNFEIIVEQWRIVVACVRVAVLVTLCRGRAIAQAAGRRLPTAAARVQTRVWSCGIMWWTKVALAQVSSENFGFPCQSTFHLLLHNHLHYHPRLAQ